MSTASSKSVQYWRWVFLVIEVVVLLAFLGAWLADRLFEVAWEPESRLLSVTLGLPLMLSWLFLLVASPFFLKTLRGVALAGWIIAFGLLLLAMLTPAL
jgi:hypothetical protein